MSLHSDLAFRYLQCLRGLSKGSFYGTSLMVQSVVCNREPLQYYSLEILSSWCDGWIWQGTHGWRRKVLDPPCSLLLFIFSETRLTDTTSSLAKKEWDMPKQVNAQWFSLVTRYNKEHTVIGTAFLTKSILCTNDIWPTSQYYFTT